MTDALSLWRSPLDQVAIEAAHKLAARQPRCDKTIDQLPPDTTPAALDLIPLWRQQDNTTVGVSIQTLAALFTSGSFNFAFNTDLSALGIYNYGNFVGAPGGTATQNVTALQNMIAQINASASNPSSIGGGWVWIPQYNFQVYGTLNTTNAPGGYLINYQTVWQGLGGGGSGGAGGAHFLINDTGGAASTFLNISGPHSSGGVEMRSLAFQWINAQYVGDTAVYLGTWAGVLYRCTFTNVPCCINTGGYTQYAQAGLQCCIDKCQISYNSGPAGATMIVLGSEQAEVLGPSEMIQTGVGGVSGPFGPANCTLIAIGGGAPGAENIHMTRLHIANWNIGIDYADTNNAFSGTHSGCQRDYIEGCEFQCWQTCINLTTYSNTGQIYDQKIIGNTMLKAQNSTDGHPIMLIDNGAMGPGSSPAPNGNIASIDVIGNTIFSNVTNDTNQTHPTHNGVAQQNQYGLQINGGQGIRVIGGKIANVGTNAGNDGTANIAITAVNGSPGPHTVSIIGVGLQPTMSNVGSSYLGAGASMWALLVTANLTGGTSVVEVRDCNMLGYTGITPVSVTGTISPGGLYIKNCLGYNDLNLVLAGSGSTLSLTQAVSASIASTITGGAGINYYGPSQIMFITNASGPTLFTLNGIQQSLPASTYQVIYLPSPYDRFLFSLQPVTNSFNWLGK